MRNTCLGEGGGRACCISGWQGGTAYMQGVGMRGNERKRMWEEHEGCEMCGV